MEPHLPVLPRGQSIYPAEPHYRDCTQDVYPCKRRAWHAQGRDAAGDSGRQLVRVFHRRRQGTQRTISKGPVARRFWLSTFETIRKTSWSSRSADILLRDQRNLHDSRTEMRQILERLCGHLLWASLRQIQTTEDELSFSWMKARKVRRSTLRWLFVLR